MKIFNLIVFCLLILGCQPKGKEYTVKVMTYNIRLNTVSDSINAWPNRKDFLSSQVLFLSPDVLGVQEALPDQIKDLGQLLPNYNFIGNGRDGGDKGEYSAIYYNSKHINLEENGTFWLSETPEKISTGWDAALPRICTYGLFSTQNSSNKFWVFNTHFDHKGATARKESVKLILKKITAINTEDYPVIMMGDLNAVPDSDVIVEAKKEMLDTKDEATIKFGSDGTFNGFNYNEPVTRRIDYIFVSKSPNIMVQKYGVLSSAIDRKYLSDHFPVFAEIKFN